ncbi:MAG: hypothetical protein IE878_02140 [Epsilonproteobacteria bacterium]|nr:hypothetical protein [Campylobacterota bacterium]
MLTKFEEKLNDINSQMYDLGTRVVEANRVILRALESSDYSQFDSAKDSLDDVQSLANEIDNKIIATLALFSPEAKDLKKIVAFLKVTNEFVRASSNTTSFLSKFPSKLNSTLDFEQIMPNVILLQQATLKAFEYAVEMIVAEDKGASKDFCLKANIYEGKADDFYSLVEKDLFVEIISSKELTKDYFETLALIRKMEKIADRAASIANLQSNI